MIGLDEDSGRYTLLGDQDKGLLFFLHRLLAHGLDGGPLGTQPTLHVINRAAGGQKRR